MSTENNPVPQPTMNNKPDENAKLISNAKDITINDDEKIKAEACLAFTAVGCVLATAGFFAWLTIAALKAGTCAAAKQPFIIEGLVAAGTITLTAISSIGMCKSRSS